MQVELPADLAEFVRSEVSSGRFASDEELLVAGVRVLRAIRDEHEAAVEAVREGWESAERGEGIELAEADRLLRESFGLPAKS